MGHRGQARGIFLEEGLPGLNLEERAGGRECLQVWEEDSWEHRWEEGRDTGATAQ